MVKIEDLIDLAVKISKGTDNNEEGTLSHEGFGFIFKDFRDVSHLFDPTKSAGIYRFGSTRLVLERYEAGEKDFYSFHELGIYDDMVLAGSIKTLVPSLEFGGDELFFQVCIIVSTPSNKIFPIEIYYGPSRLTIAGWNCDFNGQLYNSFQLTTEELDLIAKKLESALWNVTPTEFKGEYYCDAGAFLMGVEGLDGFVKQIEELEDDKLPISILYNKKSWMYDEDFSKIIMSHTNSNDNIKEIKNKYGGYTRFIINNRCYDDLISFAKIKKDRICFQVLGAILMSNGAKMTEKIRKDILENSHWEDEKKLYEDIKLRELRKKYLSEFRENIKNYKEGYPIDLDIYSENFN